MKCLQVGKRLEQQRWSYTLQGNVVPFEVHDNKHADFSCSNSVEHAVRKPAQNGMADFAVHDLILLGVRINQR